MIIEITVFIVILIVIWFYDLFFRSNKSKIDTDYFDMAVKPRKKSFLEQAREEKHKKQIERNERQTLIDSGMSQSEIANSIAKQKLEDMKK